jgi:hypothetical protein
MMPIARWRELLLHRSRRVYPGGFHQDDTDIFVPQKGRPWAEISNMVLYCGLMLAC